jgi:hypothetical protein
MFWLFRHGLLNDIIINSLYRATGNGWTGKGVVKSGRGLIWRIRLAFAFKGQSTSKSHESSSNYKRNKCADYSEGQHYRQKANSSYTKQYSNPYGLMEFSCGGQPPIPKSKSSSAFSPRLSDPFWIHHRIHDGLQSNTALSEVKKWNTKHLRKLENHTNALAVNLLDNSETTQRL